ncbi:SDR family NAD(P)-dependent oxidoreductase [Roseitranquillus sediminis]|uniref:SDR family NAD(P)-dependent oxidoreductase n=1 Tax=Roseitranquillus sediminis TaxID=2809051 RepID=UPI001D0CC053|nr:SDR family NAD(P)-dependent oxidoreductase [Roseitranquillus sediminis]MBM9593980.1 SDR family NAD(P)-dependent oxidoreductase [Roseitranquillus sediminis]
MAREWALITGASEGLGSEFADIAAAAGYGVILAARRRDRLEALAAELAERHGAETAVIVIDLSDPEAPDALWREATDGRHVAILVNNAGLGRHGRFDDGGWEQELQVVQVNVLALARLFKLAVASMKRAGGGRILNVSSTAAFMPGPNMAVYHGSKAFVQSLGEAVAHELRGTGVTVTTFAPGATATGFQRVAAMQGARITRAGMQDARKVAEAGWRAMMAGRRSAVPGLVNLAFSLGPRLLPRSWNAAVAEVALSKGRPR